MKAFKFHDVEQNSEDWYQMRGGLLTSSKLGVIMATPRDLAIIMISKGEYAIANMTTKSTYKKTYESKADAELGLSKMFESDLKNKFTDTAKKYAVNIAVEQITGCKQLK